MTIDGYGGCGTGWAGKNSTFRPLPSMGFKGTVGGELGTAILIGETKGDPLYEGGRNEDPKTL